jgi:transposase
MEWATVNESRDQQVLFPQRLDEAVPANHDVRVLDKILRTVDWSTWETKYERVTGRPPIHPRIVASVILYGLFCRIVSSRMLEESLAIRLDFRWLVEGRSIDHSTICKFRTGNKDALSQLFVQLALIGKELGWVRLDSIGFDATRMRSNNSRQSSRTPERLRELSKELAAAYQQFDAQAQAADQREAEQFGGASHHQLDVDAAQLERKLAKVNAALAEVEKLETAEKTVPTRIPMTDPESRIMPNKNGGHSPNYSPISTVDIDSGMIVDAGVLNEINEDPHLMDSIARVQENFGLDSPPGKALADGLMASGENIARCHEAGVDLYAPTKTTDPTTNPAVRETLDQPVAESERGQLPVVNVTVAGVKRKQLSKDAFVFDAENNCYWCPNGEVLEFKGKTSEKRPWGGRRTRFRYKIDGEACAVCPLAELCLRKVGSGRQVTHEEHELARVAHAEKMATDQAKEIYRQRQHPTERPFAVIKSQFGMRQFLTRGLERVSQEWNWCVAAFNIHRLIGLIRNHAGPPPPACEVSPSH